MAERGKGFPRLSLASAIKVVDVASKFGKTWPKEQFAGFGSQSGASSAKSGAFAARVASLKDYGLIVADKDSVSLTDLSIQIAKPVTEQERIKAIEQAFMNVEVFKNLFDSLESGEALSIDQVAQYAVFSLGVSRESKDKFLSVFIDSGRFVKLVEYNKEQSTIILNKTKIDRDQEGRKLANQLELTEAHATAEQEVSLTDALVTSQSISEAAKPVSQKGQPFTEQGINHSGRDWTLTVLLKTSLRLDKETRTKVRDLLEAADLLSDELHALEEADD
jgi:hypothetical protein